MAMPANYIRALIVYGADDKSPFVNVLWYTATGSPTLSDPLFAAGVAGQIATIFDAALAACLPTEAKMLGVHVSWNHGGNVFDASSDFTVNTHGTIDSDQLPDYAAVVVQKRTATGGKSGRGRWYVGCVAELATDTSTVDIAYQSAYDDLAIAFASSFTEDGVTCHPAHQSRKDTSLYVITSTAAQYTLATQRRRRLRPAF